MLSYFTVDGILGFKDAHISLSSINVLLGANNTGKSSLFKIMQLMQNSILSIYRNDALNMNFQNTKLSNINYVETMDKMSFSFPFEFIKNIAQITFSYNKKGELSNMSISCKGIDLINIRSNELPTYINFKEILKIIDKNLNPNGNLLFDILLMQENPNDIKTGYDKAEIYYNSWRNYREKRLQEPNLFVNISNLDNELHIEKEMNFLETLSYIENDNVSELISFFNRAAEVEQKDISEYFDNYYRYSSSISGFFDYMDMVSLLTVDLKYLEDVATPLNSDIIKKVYFFENNKDFMQITSTGKLFLEYVKDSFERGFHILINELNNISHLPAVRLNTFPAYISSQNNNELDKLSLLFIEQSNSKKEFVNKWLKELGLGKVVHKKTGKDVNLDIDLLLFYKIKNGEIDEDIPYTLNKLGTGVIQIIILLMKIITTKNNSLILIEEPELNLHPRLQAKIANILIDANKEFLIKFIIETHNEYMLSNFQNLIADKLLDIRKICVINLSLNEDLTKKIDNLIIDEYGGIDYEKIHAGDFYPQGYSLHLSLLNKRREMFIEIFEKTKKLAINNNETNEDIIYEVISNYLKNQDYSIYEEELNTLMCVPDISTILTLDVINLLTSGLFLHNNLSANISNDFSPAVIQLGKAMENVIISACKSIFAQKIDEIEVITMKRIESWLFNTSKDIEIIKISSFQAQSLLYALSEPRIKSIFSTSSYGNIHIVDILHIDKLQSNKEKFNEEDLVSRIRKLRNDAAHKSTPISFIKSSEHLDRVIEFFKMWIDIKTLT